MRFGTSKSPKRTRSSTTCYCPGRPGHWHCATTSQARCRSVASSRNDWTPCSDAYFASPLALCARRVSSAASRLPGFTRLRFTLHGAQRANKIIETIGVCPLLLTSQGMLGNPHRHKNKLAGCFRAVSGVTAHLAVLFVTFLAYCDSLP